MSFPSQSIAELKTQASILNKRLRSTTHADAIQAAGRLLCLPRFVQATPEEVLRNADSVQRKDLLRVVAIEQGFASWQALVAKARKREAWRARRAQSEFSQLYPHWAIAFTNEWYHDYRSAQAALEVRGGYLLPHNNDYFIAAADYVAQLGLDPHDPDWDLIGYDWARPADTAAHARLAARLSGKTVPAGGAR